MAASGIESWQMIGAKVYCKTDADKVFGAIGPASRQQTVQAVVVKTRPLVNILESAALLPYGLVVLLLSSMPMVP
ncbi:MAG: hypothetical protein ABSG92_09760 [Conexivisphaerales archaeon]